MIKRLIFDVDGTLITGVNFLSAVEKTLKRIGIYSEDNVKKFFAGMNSYEDKFDNYNNDDYVRHIGQTINQQLPINFLDIFFKELKLCIPKENESVFHTLYLLSEKYELVLLTNYFRKSQLNRLNNMGIGHFFKECYGEELIKPNFNSYIKACGNNKPNECVMIGDDLYLDIKKAQEIGLNTIFINSKNISIKNIDTVMVHSVKEIDDELIRKLEEYSILSG